MKLIERHSFTNDKAFEIFYLEEEDRRIFRAPPEDVIGMRRVYGKNETPMTVMRPDEALLMARMLVNAVHQLTSEYRVEEPK